MSIQLPQNLSQRVSLNGHTYNAPSGLLSFLLSKHSDVLTEQYLNLVYLAGYHAALAETKDKPTLPMKEGWKDNA